MKIWLDDKKYSIKEWGQARGEFFIAWNSHPLQYMTYQTCEVK